MEDWKAETNVPDAHLLTQGWLIQLDIEWAMLRLCKVATYN